jgi:hypothetical protein
MRQLTAREGRNGAILDRRRAGQPELEAAGNLGIQPVLWQQLLRLNSSPPARLCEVRVMRSRLLLRQRGAGRILCQPCMRSACGYQHAVPLANHLVAPTTPAHRRQSAQPRSNDAFDSRCYLPGLWTPSCIACMGGALDRAHARGVRSKINDITTLNFSLSVISRISYLSIFGFWTRCGARPRAGRRGLAGLVLQI